MKAMCRHMKRHRCAAAAAKINRTRALRKETEEALDAWLINPSTFVGRAALDLLRTSQPISSGGQHPTTPTTRVMGYNPVCCVVHRTSRATPGWQVTPPPLPLSSHLALPKAAELAGDAICSYLGTSDVLPTVAVSGEHLSPAANRLQVDVAALGVRIELARSHVFDHTLTQRTDIVSIAHGELLPE